MSLDRGILLNRTAIISILLRLQLYFKTCIHPTRHNNVRCDSDNVSTILSKLSFKLKMFIPRFSDSRCSG